MKQKMIDNGRGEIHELITAEGQRGPFAPHVSGAALHTDRRPL